MAGRAPSGAGTPKEQNSQVQGTGYGLHSGKPKAAPTKQSGRPEYLSGKQTEYLETGILCFFVPQFRARENGGPGWPGLPGPGRATVFRWAERPSSPGRKPRRGVPCEAGRPGHGARKGKTVSRGVPCEAGAAGAWRVKRESGQQRRAMRSRAVGAV